MPLATPETLLREAAKYAQQRITGHIERLAAAYIKCTDIKPEEAVMCYKQEYDGNGTVTTKIWFEKKDHTPPEDLRYTESLRQAKYRGFETVADLIIAYDKMKAAEPYDVFGANGT